MSPEVSDVGTPISNRKNRKRSRSDGVASAHASTPLMGDNQPTPKRRKFLRRSKSPQRGTISPSNPPTTSSPNISDKKAKISTPHSLSRLRRRRRTSLVNFNSADEAQAEPSFSKSHSAVAQVNPATEERNETPVRIVVPSRRRRSSTGSGKKNSSAKTQNPPHPSPPNKPVDGSKDVVNITPRRRPRASPSHRRASSSVQTPTQHLNLQEDSNASSSDRDLNTPKKNPRRLSSALCAKPDVLEQDTARNGPGKKPVVDLEGDSTSDIHPKHSKNISKNRRSKSDAKLPSPHSNKQAEPSARDKTEKEEVREDIKKSRRRSSDFRRRKIQPTDDASPAVSGIQREQTIAQRKPTKSTSQPANPEPEIGKSDFSGGRKRRKSGVRAHSSTPADGQSRKRQPFSAPQGTMDIRHREQSNSAPKKPSVLKSEEVSVKVRAVPAELKEDSKGAHLPRRSSSLDVLSSGLTRYASESTSALKSSVTKYPSKPGKDIESSLTKKRSRLSDKHRGDDLRSESISMKSRHVPEKEVTVKEHELSFVVPHAAGITALAGASSGEFVAVARTDSSIELRDTRHNWRTIAYCDGGAMWDKAKVATMSFTPCGLYLLVGRLDGLLSIYRREPSGSLVHHVDVSPGGSAIWCMAVNPSMTGNGTFEVALGCNDGYVRILTLDSTSRGTSGPLSLPRDSVHYLTQRCEHTVGRMLTIAWAMPHMGCTSNPRLLACGDSEGGIRWLHADSGKCLNRGKIVGLHKKKVVIWTLQFVADGKFVATGDDRGVMSVWDARTGALVEEVRLEGFKGSLWSSTVLFRGQSKETVIFGCANGAVGGLRSGMSVAGVWPTVRGIRFHKHDVKGLLCLSGNRFLTGSLDSRMALVHGTELHSDKLFPKYELLYPEDGVRRTPCVEIDRANRLIINRFGRSARIYSMQAEEKVKLLRQLPKVSFIKQDIIACAVSVDTTLFAVSAPGCFQLFLLARCPGGLLSEMKDDAVFELRGVPSSVFETLHGCAALRFCGNTVLAITRCHKRLVVYDPEEGLMRSYSMTQIGSAASSLELLSCVSTMVAMSDSNGVLHLGAVKHGSSLLEIYFQPSPVESLGEGGITSMGLSPSGGKVAYATTQSDLTIMDISSDNKALKLEHRFPTAVQSICFSEDGESVIFAGSHDYWTVSANLDSASTEPTTSGDKPSEKLALDRVRFRKAMLACGVLGPSEVAAVRRNWSVIEATLPETVSEKRYKG